MPRRKESITDSDNFTPYFLLFLVLTSGATIMIFVYIGIGILVLVIAFVLFLKFVVNAPQKDSEERKAFERANAVSPKREWALAFGGILMNAAGESTRTMKLIDRGPDYLADIRQGFTHMWGISDGEDALEVLEELVNKQGHTDKANALYAEHLKPYFASGKTITTISDPPVSELQPYFEAFDGLRLDPMVKFSPEEMSAIDNFAAWDLGRVAMIGRYSVAFGYITEEQAWPFIEQAAQTASKIYKDWAQFFQAYALGRALAYGGNGAYDYLSYEIAYLLYNENSPVKQHNFKG